MIRILVILTLAISATAQTRYDRLYAAWQRNPDSAVAYERLMREWHRVDRRNRQIERRLVPVVQQHRASNARLCDGSYDESKMRIGKSE